MEQRHHYHLLSVETYKTFHESVELCKDIGGELAVPNSNVNESSWIKVYFQKCLGKLLNISN